MVLINKTYADMLREIGQVETRIEGTLVPRCLMTVRGFGSVNTFLSPEYLKALYGTAEMTYDRYAFDTIVNEQVSNMIDRGHKGDKRLEARIKIVKGSKGCILRFEDSGGGFDYTKRTKEQGGAGRAVFDMKGIESAYEGAGNILNIMVMNRN